LERLREPIADPLGGGLVAGHDRVEQANGVPHGDLTPRTEPGEKAGKLETVEIGGELGDGKARQIAADHVGKRLAADAAERIEDGESEERVTMPRNQWQQSKLCPALELLGVAAAVETERRAPAPVTVEPYGQGQRLTQLLQVLRIAEDRAFVEPFGGQALGRNPDARPPVGERDGSADHRLRRPRHGNDAEAKWEPQRDVTLVAGDGLEFEFGHGAG